MKLIIHTDGGARGNPGPAAVGVVIEVCQCVSVSVCQEKKRKEVVSFGRRIGETTNNVAEYTAVAEALKSIKDKVLSIKENTEKLEIEFYLDSTLVVNQLNGLFKVKDGRLQELLMGVRQLEQEVGGVIRYQYVPREQNTRADLLVNQALDSR